MKKHVLNLAGAAILASGAMSSAKAKTMTPINPDCGPLMEKLWKGVDVPGCYIPQPRGSDKPPCCSRRNGRGSSDEPGNGRQK